MSEIEIHRMLQKEVSEMSCQKVHGFVKKHFKSKDEKDYMVFPCKDQTENSLDDGMSKSEIHRLLQKEVSELEY